jgi:glycerol uptake facilitator-like aquaporin
MDPLSLLLVILALGVIPISWLIGRAAEKKGRSKWSFFWISLLLFPLGAIVMGIIVATIASPNAPPAVGHED